MNEAAYDTPTFSSFIDYKRVLLTLTSDLKQLRAFSDELKLKRSVDLIDEVLDRIEKDSFTIAVVGEFKRGKSTFINALLGQDILPSDILPCSATLNRVTYGLTPLVKVRFRDGREEDVGINQLTDYVTRLTPEAEELATTVREAVVYYPVRYCQNNVEVIDTPGLNDDANMTAVTLSVLPEVDTAILVILAQSPFGEYEREFLETKLLTSDLGRVIFVITGIDRLNGPEDAERIVQSIEGRIGRYIMKRAEAQYGKDSAEYEVYLKKIGKPRVFGLSAYQALKGKLNNDQALFEQSRFPEFETALERFLTEDRGAISLQVPVNRAIASATEIQKAIGIQENALRMKKEEFDQAYAASVAEINTLRQRKGEEMQQIDAAAERVKQQVAPLVGQLEGDLKHAAGQLIDATPITASDIRNKQAQEALTERLGKKVSSAVQQAAQRLTDRVQAEIERGVAAEMERLRDFGGSLDKFLKQLEIQFGLVEADADHQDRSAEAVAAAMAVVTGFGGIWSGYRAAGAKGAAVGAVGSAGTFFAYGLFAGLLSLPISWPAVIAVGVLSIFTGGWLSRTVFGGSRADKFKEAYKARVLEEIANQLRHNDVQRQVNDYIAQTFNALRHKLHQEVEVLLTDTQEKLAELRARHERHDTLSEHEREELAEMRTRTQAIQSNAQRLSKQLVQILNV